VSTGPARSWCRGRGRCGGPAEFDAAVAFGDARLRGTAAGDASAARTQALVPGELAANAVIHGLP
jgi:hypothetical protein